MSNEVKPKPAPEYEIITLDENPRMVTIRKIEAVDFKLDDIHSYVAEVEKEKAKHDSLVKYNEAVVENIKGFHPEIIEFYEKLEGEKKTAMLLYCKALQDIEKNQFVSNNYKTEIDNAKSEIDTIEQKFGLGNPKTA